MNPCTCMNPFQVDWGIASVGGKVECGWMWCVFFYIKIYNILLFVFARCQLRSQGRLWWACCMPSDSSRSYTQHVDASLQVSWHGEVPSWFLFRNPHWTLFDLCVLPRTYHWKSVVWLAQFKENRSVTMQLFLFSACELMNWTWQIYANYIECLQYINCRANTRSTFLFTGPAPHATQVLIC